MSIATKTCNIWKTTLGVVIKHNNERKGPKEIRHLKHFGTCNMQAPAT